MKNISTQTFDFTRGGQPWPILEVIHYACCIAGVKTVARRLKVAERTVWRWFDSWSARRSKVRPRNDKKIRRRLSTLQVDASGAHFGNKKERHGV